MKDRIAMTLSVLMRMGASLVVFVLMARGLGPATYGVVVTVISYATLMSLLTDFGFASKTLRDMAANPAAGAELLNDCLNVKAVLTLFVLAVGLGAILLLPMESEVRLATGLLGAAVLIGGIGDLSLIAYRATGHYAVESRLTIWTSLLHLGAIGWISLAFGDVVLLGAAFLVSRVVYASLALREAIGLFPGGQFRALPLGQIATIARSAGSWAADSGLNYLNSQIDGLVVAPIFGLHAAGIYQAGARFVQAALGMVAILANIHIPRLAGGADIRGVDLKVLVEFVSVGAVFAMLFLFAGPPLTYGLLGPEFAEVDALWPGFATFVFFRYAAAAAGAQLAAWDTPKVRVLGQLLGLSIVVFGVAITASIGSLVTLPWVMAASAGAVGAFYWSALALRRWAKVT